MIYIQCPKCRRKVPQKRQKCKCGTNLKSLKERIYWVRYYPPGHPNGKWKKIGPSITAAKHFEGEMRREIAAGRISPSLTKGRMTIREFWEKHELPASRKKNRPSWLERKIRIWEGHLKDFFGDVQLRDLTPERIELYREKRIEEGVTPATVNRELAVLKRLVNHALELEFIDRNPFKRIKFFREEPKDFYILSPEELERLLKAASEGIRPIIAFLAATGVRRGTALNLKWSQVDLERRMLRIPASESKSRKPLDLPLSDVALKILKEQKKKGTISCVFPNPKTGKPYSGDGFKCSFKRALKKANLPESLRVHDLRHFWATRAVMQGVSPFILQALLGHHSLQMVTRYLTLDMTAKLEAANRIAPAESILRGLGLR